MSSPHQSVPPAKSSHTPATGADTGGGSTSTVIRIPRLAFLGVFILLMCAFFAFVGWPIALWWLLLIPVAVGVWVLRSQTSVSADGLDLRTVFRSRHLDWSQVKGVRIPKRQGFVRADLTDGTEVKLPAVSYDRLRELALASGGHIPNPFATPEPPVETGAEGETDGGFATEPSADSVSTAPASTAGEGDAEATQTASSGSPLANGAAPHKDTTSHKDTAPTKDDE